MTIYAIDLGFLYSNAIVNGKRIMIKSVVGDAHPQRFNELNMSLKDGEDCIKVKFHTNTHFVSDLAINQSSIIHHSLKGDRFNTDATEILIKAIFGMSRANGDVGYVVSGLPVSHYSKYKNDITNLFLSNGYKIHNYDIEVNHQNLVGSIKIIGGKFVPQPFGVLLDSILDSEGEISNKELANKVVAVIDIGFGTTDVYVSDSLTPLDKLSFSLPTAMNSSYKLISNKLEERFGVTLQLHSVEQIARIGEFRNKGKIYSIKELTDWSYKNVAHQIIDEIINKWGNSIHEIDEILLAGGGGIALSRWIKPEFPNINLVENAQWSVVNGYHKWGVRHFNKGK
jgi:hypothetical protein